MEIIINEAERDLLVELLGNKNNALKRKLLKEKRRRKPSTYKKCSNEQKANFKRLEEIVRSNYKITNQEIICKLGVSKANYYKLYNEKAKELKKKFKDQALF